MHGVVLPIGDRDEGDIGAISDDHLHQRGVGGRSAVSHHEGGLRVVTDPHDRVAVHDLIQRGPPQVHDDRLVERDIGRNLDEVDGRGVESRHRSHPVPRRMPAKFPRLLGGDL